MKKGTTMAQRYVQYLQNLEPGEQPILRKDQFVRYPVEGASADLLIFSDTSSVIEVDGTVISSFGENEKYAHHFKNVNVNIDASYPRR